jgi:hypothetical protein
VILSMLLDFKKIPNEFSPGWWKRSVFGFNRLCRAWSGVVRGRNYPATNAQRDLNRKAIGRLWKR